MCVGLTWLQSTDKERATNVPLIYISVVTGTLVESVIGSQMILCNLSAVRRLLEGHDIRVLQPSKKSDAIRYL